MEEQILLKVPNEIANRLNQLLNNIDTLDSISPSVIFTGQEPKKRHVNMKFNNKMYNGVLVDLPTIIESYKCINQPNIYKSNTISQMIVIDDKYDDNNIKQVNINHNDGITPPTQGIRSGRYERNIIPSKQLVSKVESRLDELRRNVKRERIELVEEYIEITDDEADESTTSEDDDNIQRSKSTPLQLQATTPHTGLRSEYTDASEPPTELIHDTGSQLNTPYHGNTTGRLSLTATPTPQHTTSLYIHNDRTTDQRIMSSTPLLQSPSVYNNNQSATPSHIVSNTNIQPSPALNVPSLISPVQVHTNIHDDVDMALSEQFNNNINNTTEQQDNTTATQDTHQQRIAELEQRITELESRKASVNILQRRQLQVQIDSLQQELQSLKT